MNLIRALLCCLALSLSGQALSQVAPPVVAAGQAGSAPVAGATDADYVLGVADRVRVTVYDEPTLSGEYPVNANGRIAMPLIGEVAAAGSTAGALREKIEALLGNGYLTSPKVAIDVLTFRPFYILGEVNKAGQYPYSSGLTVMNAVATAAGFTYRANQKYVYIKRANEPGEKKVRLTPDLEVKPGDTIRVGERFF